MAQRVLERIGIVSLIAEPKLCVYTQSGNTRLMMSSHVDDLKGDGDDESHDPVLGEFERELGKFKVCYGEVECIGSMREQQPVTGHGCVPRGLGICGLYIICITLL